MRLHRPRVRRHTFVPSSVKATPEMIRAHIESKTGKPLDPSQQYSLYVDDDLSSYQRTNRTVSEAEHNGDFPVRRTQKYAIGLFWDVYRDEWRYGQFEQVLTVPQNRK